MDLEIVGRHALFFDDDSMATFVNSRTALVEWNSLLIDRYDVRHLLSCPPPPRVKRRRPISDLEPDLDEQRYLDLAGPDVREKQVIPTHEQINDADVFEPPFPVPDVNLPPTHKLHQIIATTSTFVSKHGAQSEIVLRVKQGSNPKFGFLMPDHHLHPYFRFLVQHQELLTQKPSREDIRIETGKDAGDLSLQKSETNKSAEHNGGVMVADSNGPDGSKSTATKSSLTSYDKASLARRNPNFLQRKQINAEANATEKLLTSDKLQSSAMPAQPKPKIVEPPIEMKKAISKIVDFIQNNGKELEATLAAQDVKCGMFPFLRPDSLYHAYYRYVLQKAEELKLCDRGDITKKKDIRQEKMATAVKEDTPAFGSVLPGDSVKKEKQKMASEKPKIELLKETFKPVEPQMRITVDVNTTAAILQAARRGIRNPQLGILSGNLLNETSQSLGNDGSNSSYKSTDLAKSTVSGSAVACEADSSKAGLSKEQKLKAERLKRAKMFVTMLKPGAQQAQQAEPLRSLSVEPLDYGLPGLGSNAAKEREGSSVPFEAETKQTDDGNSERLSKKNCRSRAQRDDDYEMKEEEDDEESSMEEVTGETKSEKKHSSRKRHDRHKQKTRHPSKDRNSLDKHESSSDNEYDSRVLHRHNKHRKSSDRHEPYDSSDNERDHQHRSNKHTKDVDHSKDKRSHNHRSRKLDKHLDSSDDDHHRHNRHRSSRRKHQDSSDVEHGHRHKSCKRMKKDEKTEEEETVSKSGQSDLKAAPEDNIPYPQEEPTQVSDELRAKIRAMLADTL